MIREIYKHLENMCIFYAVHTKSTSHNNYLKPPRSSLLSQKGEKKLLTENNAYTISIHVKPHKPIINTTNMHSTIAYSTNIISYFTPQPVLDLSLAQSLCSHLGLVFPANSPSSLS